MGITGVAGGLHAAPLIAVLFGRCDGERASTARRVQMINGYTERQSCFPAEYRGQLRSELLDYAANDKRLGGVAVTGSAAVGREDRWSDIDLAFGVTDPGQVGAVLSDFTRLMYDRHEALHHYDVSARAWIYRVFFLPGTLQVDLAFVPKLNSDRLALHSN